MCYYRKSKKSLSFFLSKFIKKDLAAIHNLSKLLYKNLDIYQSRIGEINKMYKHTLYLM